jgi:hypothetical protein
MDFISACERSVPGVFKPAAMLALLVFVLFPAISLRRDYRLKPAPIFRLRYGSSAPAFLVWC